MAKSSWGRFDPDPEGEDRSTLTEWLSGTGGIAVGVIIALLAIAFIVNAILSVL